MAQPPLPPNQPPYQPPHQPNQPPYQPPAGPPGMPPPGYQRPIGGPGWPGGPGQPPGWPPLPPDHNRGRRGLWIALSVVAVLVIVGGGLIAFFVTRDNGDDDNSSAQGAGAPSSSAPSESASPSESAAPSSGTSSGAADPAAMPRAGQCRAIPAKTGFNAKSDTSPIVDCSQSHTGKTYYVGSYTGQPDISVQDKQCRARLAGAVGTNPRQLELTLYDAEVYYPDQQQAASGAHWFRCDLVVIDYPHKQLRPLPTGGSMVPSPLPDGVAKCMTSQDTTIPCDEDHVGRGYKVWVLKGGSKPPSKHEIAEQSIKACTNGLAGVTWQTGSYWSWGDHYAVCYRSD